MKLFILVATAGATLLAALTVAPAHAAPVPISIFHTNDLHSRFRPTPDVLNLGGVARLKTLLDRLRAKHPQSLLLDGGDWSEGSIYYNLQSGQESLEMLDELGYDAVVVGNHDWINGPDVLLDAAARAKPKHALLGLNFDISGYRHKRAWNKQVLPYTIREIGGVKVAIIGVVTYEFIFDSYVTPIKITEPFGPLRELSKKLRPSVDAIIAVSHNSIPINAKLLEAASEVDLIVGGHDHVKLAAPTVVKRRDGSHAWVVEAGYWGHYLGQVDITVTPKSELNPGSRSVTLGKSRLHPVDSSIQEDPGIDARIDRLERLLEIKYGKIFDTKVADNHIHVNKHGSGNLMGSLTTDAYRDLTHADFALDQSQFIYGELYPGRVNQVDVFMSNPAIYDPRVQRAWNVQTFKMKGQTLHWLLNVLLYHPKVTEFGVLSSSGLRVTYDPGWGSPLMRGLLLSPETNLIAGMTPYPGGIDELFVGDRRIDLDKQYNVAAGKGILEAIRFLNNLVPGAVPISSLVDTGKEAWLVMADYLQQRSPITQEDIPVGERMRTRQPDLVVLHSDVQIDAETFDASNARARVRAVVRNFGATASKAGATISVMGDRSHATLSESPEWTAAGKGIPIPGLAPGQSFEATWDSVALTGSDGLFPVTVKATTLVGEENTLNNEQMVWFKP